MNAINTSNRFQTLKSSALQLLLVMLIVAVCTLVCLPFRDKIIPLNLISLYLIGVVFVASKFGIWPSIFASILSVLSFNFFFTKPYHSFEFYDNSYYFTFTVMLFTSLIVGSMTAQLSQLLRAARKEEQSTSALFNFAKQLSEIQNKEIMLEFAAGYIAKEFDAKITIIDNTNSAISDLDLKSLETKSKIKIKLGENANSLGTYYSSPNLNADGFTKANNLLQQTYVGLLASALMRIKATETAAILHAQSESEKLRNVLLSSLSHDLRTPLTIMNGTLSNLFKYRKSLPREGVRELSALWKQLERLQKFVTNLLRMAAISSGNLNLNKEIYSVQEIIGAAQIKIGESLGGRKILHSVVGQLPFISVDGALIEQVVFNLLDNAISHTTENGSIIIIMSKSAKNLIVTIEDDGDGIPEGQETQIFREFKTNKFSGDRRTGGTGLGLAICKGIIEAHGGKISAQNNPPPKRGASFQFKLPLA